MATLLERLNGADIAAIIYRTARLLMDRMNADGVTIVAWEEYKAITRCHNKEAARKHVAALAKLGLCDWQAGGATVVVWWHYVDAPNERENAPNERVDIIKPQNAPNERVDITTDAPNERENAPNERENAPNERAEAAPIGCLVDPIPMPNGYTNGAAEPPAKVGHALTVALLLNCQVAYAKAVAIAGKTPYLEVRRQVAGWLPMREAARNAPGLLIHRIETRAPVGEPSAEFKRSRYYLDYLTPAEKAAQDDMERQAEALAAAEVDSPAIIPPSPVASRSEAPAGLAAIWQRVITEVTQGQPLGSPITRWLAGSRLEEAGTVDNGAGLDVPLYRVWVCYPEGVGWLNNRAAMALRRSLGAALGLRVIVEIVAEDDS